MHGPMNLAKTLKLRFSVGDLDLPERKHTSSRVEEEEDAQRCFCGNADESRTRVVGECELYEEEGNVLRR